MYRGPDRHLDSVLRPGIPDYVDDFKGESDDGPSFYLVQEFVEGKTLEASLDSRSWSEGEVLEHLALVDYLS